MENIDSQSDSPNNATVLIQNTVSTMVDATSMKWLAKFTGYSYRTIAFVEQNRKYAWEQWETEPCYTTKYALVRSAPEARETVDGRTE